MALMYSDQTGKLQPEPSWLLHPKISNVWNADGSENKEKATKDLKYIYFIADPLSPFRERYSANDISDAIKRDALQDLKYNPSKLVKEAIEYYRDLSDTKVFKLFNASDTLVDVLYSKIQNVTADKDFKEVKLAMELLQEVAPLVTTLQKAKEAYKASLTGELKTNKSNISKRELPRSQR